VALREKSTAKLPKTSGGRTSPLATKRAYKPKMPAEKIEPKKQKLENSVKAKKSVVGKTKCQDCGVLVANFSSSFRRHVNRQCVICIFDKIYLDARNIDKILIILYIKRRVSVRSLGGKWSFLWDLVAIISVSRAASDFGPKVGF
jgi:hypothetical protein